MSAYFVTAIGTDIGKTYVGASLLRAWRSQGQNVAAFKPLMSGFDETELTASDAGCLLNAMGQAVTPQAVDAICLYRFTPPIAPNVAMRRAGIAQDYQRIVDFVSSGISTDPRVMTLVEGAGGVMSPVTDRKLHIDLIADLDLPVILVASSYLGAVSHTLTAIECLKARGLKIAALIVSQPDSEAQDPSHLISEVGMFHHLPSYELKFQSSAELIAHQLSPD